MFSLQSFNLTLLYRNMSDVDDEIKETKTTRFRKGLSKLEIIEKALNKLNELKPVKKPMNKDSDAYKNKRHVYVNKLNSKDIKFPKKETL